MILLARECVLVIVVELVFVSELTNSPYKIPLQSKIKVTLKKFDGAQLPQHGTLPFLQNLIDRLVPPAESVQAKLKC